MVVVFAAVHLWRTLVLSAEDDVQMLIDFALIPARWSIGYLADGARMLSQHVSMIQGSERVWQSQLAGFLIQEADPRPWTVITYAFLHGSWMHIGLNVIWLAVFGIPIARRWGGDSFPDAVRSDGGWRGAGSLCVEAFRSHPDHWRFRDRVRHDGSGGLVCFCSRTPDLGAPEQPHHERFRLSLAGLIQNRTALGFIAIWFVTNYVFAVMMEPMGFTDASIAWQAHIGGFLVGLLLLPFMDRMPGSPKR